MRRFAWLLLFWFCDPIISPAWGNITASEPQGIVDILHNHGYDASLTHVADGDPMIRFHFLEKSIQILFYGCNRGHNCQSLQLSTGYDLPNGISFDRINLWMRGHRWAKVYLDTDMDPYLQYDIPTVPDGIADKLFLVMISSFGSSVEDFSRFINFK
ncbi:MAG: YbjN domain-containing protein, partial [Zymomonas mobilis subsp. pomaceae]